MTHPLLHYIIPVAVLLLLRFDKKLVLLLSPLALIPDLDYFIPPHRALGHSVFLGFALIGIAYLLLKDRFKRNDLLIVSIVLFFSHPILDGQVGWLYPLSDRSFGYRYDLHAWVWNDTVDVPEHPFSTAYKLLQITGIFIFAGLIYAFWPSRAMPKERHSGRPLESQP